MLESVEVLILTKPLYNIMRNEKIIVVKLKFYPQ